MGAPASAGLQWWPVAAISSSCWYCRHGLFELSEAVMTLLKGCYCLHGLIVRLLRSVVHACSHYFLLPIVWCHYTLWCRPPWCGHAGAVWQRSPCIFGSFHVMCMCPVVFLPSPVASACSLNLHTEVWCGCVPVGVPGFPLGAPYLSFCCVLLREDGRW